MRSPDHSRQPRPSADLPVDLFALPLAAVDAPFEGAALLDTTDRARLARLRRPLDRARFVAGRVLVRTLIGERCAVAPERVELGVDARGRLRVVAPADAPWVSLAHAGDAIVVALSPVGRVGVDLEPLAAAVPALERIALTPAERRSLLALPPADRPLAALRAWTVKESYAKLVGRGLGIEPTALSLARIDGRRRVEVRSFVAPIAGVPYQLALAASRRPMGIEVAA